MLHHHVPNVVVLVPFKSDDLSRITIWNAVRDWWRHSVNIPIFVGESDPQAFNISLARNRAAINAGDWDVAVILDADTLLSNSQVQKGIEVAMKTGAVVYPYTERWELDHEGTQMFIENHKSQWYKHAKRHAYEHLAAVLSSRMNYGI